MKVIQGYLILTIAIGFSLHAKDKGVSKITKPVHKQLSIIESSKNLRILGPSVDYDIIREEDNAMPARARNSSSRSVADTMEYIPADGEYNAYFYGYQQIGDAFLMAFQMPTDATIKGVNVPVYHWGTGDQEITISLHKLSYPYGSDGQLYSTNYVDGAGWLGGYDMNSDGWMIIEGTTYTEGGMAGTCDSDDTVIPGAQDPLGTIDSVGPTGVPTKGLIWPDSLVATGNPDTHPNDQDNWYATTNYGTEPELLSGDWVGILVQATGDGGGEDPTLGFYYEAADGVVPGNWVGLKFYGECGGTSGNGGWHIRHWMWNFQLAVELTGDRGPIFGDMTELLTTTSTADRSFSVAVTDDNPADGSAGVESVTLSYQLDSLTAAVNTVSLSLTSGNSESGTWMGTIPGQEAGTFVYWSLTATDVNGNTTNISTNSYFIWHATAGRDLIFWNDREWLYSNFDYAQTIYFYWGEDHFDIWDANYGNLNDEVVSSYDVIIELGMDDNPHNADDVIDDWWNMTKTYIVAAGDEWLYTKYGIGDYITVPEGDVAREILGISSFYQDINSQHNPNNLSPNHSANRLITVAANVVEPLQDFVDSVGVPLHYNPTYDPGHNNLLDGVSPVSGYNVAMTAYAGVMDDNGVPTDSTEHNVMIYSTINGRSAFLSFDVIGLYTGSHHNDNQHWVGAHSYSGYNVSPLALVYEWLDAATVTNIPSITITSENIVHGDTGLVDVSINDNYPELSSIDMSFSGFQGKLDFIEIVADNSSLLGSQGWLIQANDTDSLLITASAGAQNISGAGKLFSLKFAVPDTLSSQYVHVNLVDFLGNTDIDGAFETNGGVQSVWGPTIGFTTSETVGDYPITVTFTDTSSAGTFPITTWSWDFGDDSTASDQNVTNTYELPGVYDVSLNIADEFGLTDTLVYQGLVQLDTIYGDVDWNAQVQSFDASMILKDLVDMIELDDMQVIVADVSTDNTLSTLDATLILQHVVGTIGALPYDAGSQYVASGNVSMDDRGTGPGIPIDIPLHINNGSNIYGFEMKVEFDHTLLEFDTLVLSELMDNYLLIYNSDTDGELIVAASGSNPDGETGSFGTLTFNVSDNFSDETVVSITRMRWNEGPEVEDPASMTVSYALAIESELLPDKFALHQNYPNPFNPVTRINYDLPEQSQVSIIIYDMLGRRVRTLIQRMEEPGYRAALWNATNDYGKPVSAGIYIYQIQTSEFIQTRKMILLK